LSEQVCSLNPGEDRLAFSVFFTLNEDAHLVNHSISFERTVVRSCSKLNYEVAQKIIDGKIKNVEDMPSAFAALDGHSTDDLIQDVQKLHKLTQKLRKLRLMNGALILKKSAIQFD